MTSEVPKLRLNDGHQMPIVGLGTWLGNEGKLREAVKVAIDCGYRHFDCALCYENENEVGDGLREKISSGDVTREDLFVTSKLWNTYHHRDRVPKCCQRSLKELGLEYLDLYLIHWPYSYQEGDVLYPTDENGRYIPGYIDYVETWKGMEDCVKKGLVRSIGVSNFNSEQITRILESCEIKPSVLQVESHPLLNQNKLISFCQQRDMQVTAFAPLGSPGRVNPENSGPNVMDDPRIKDMASKYQVTPAQILLRYQVQRGVAVIPKSITRERIENNIQIFHFELTKEEMELLNEFGPQHRYFVKNRMKDHPYYPFNIEF